MALPELPSFFPDSLGPPADPSRVPAAAAVMTTPLLTCKVSAVQERGLKVRIVSVPPAHASFAGTVLGHALMDRLRKLFRCRRFLEGERHLAVEEVIRRRYHNDLIVSTDLTAATDLLPLDLVSAIVEGIIDGWDGIPQIWSDALRTLTGKQRLE